MVATNPSYRNTRVGYYSDKTSDTLEIGTIIEVLKSDQNSFEHTKTPDNIPSGSGSSSNPWGGTTAYTNITGNAVTEVNPDFQYRGYLYCDGSEYNIKDYPALFAILGNEYGGTANNGITISSQGSGYPSNTVVTFSAPPAGIGSVSAIGIPVITGGEITDINIQSYGAGYTTAPTITISGAGGSGAVATVTRFLNGSILPVTTANVFSVWPETNMGTFNVPDLLAKKVVGNGPVFGVGTPTIGNSSIEVGINSIDGKWYLDKAGQKSQFSLGSVTTTGYTDVRDSITSNLIGSQTIKITMDEKKIQGPPNHSHNLLHSEATKDAAYARKYTGDNYLRGYRAATGKISTFFPAGGLSYTHKHALFKRPLSDNTIASYDLYNFSGGDAGTGTIKEPGFYWASGGLGSGTYELITYVPAGLFSKFVPSSVVGGRTVTTQGTPIFSRVSYSYTTPGNYTVTIPSSIDYAVIAVAGGAGSGAAYNIPGNSGTATTVVVGNTGLGNIRSNGGGGGGAAQTSTAGGAAGTRGTTLISGSLTTASGALVTTSVGTDANAGTAGPIYQASTTGTPANTGGSGGSSPNSTGSNGTYTFVSSTPTYGPFTATSSGQSLNVSLTNSQYGLTSVKLELYGGAGATCGNFGGFTSSSVGGYDTNFGGCTTGLGGAGKYMNLSLNASRLTTTTWGFTIYPGPVGQVRAGGNGTYGDGGTGGDGYLTNDGGGGGAATVVTLGATTTPIAGAGGGGGGGGAGEGECGTNGTNNTQFGDTAQATSENLFSGAGATGGSYGCTGGGGGGGGGGVGTASQSTSAGGSGGGGGGNGGHGAGYGGARGLSSFRSDYFTLTSAGNTSTGAGKAILTYVTNESYWSSGGGGGGQPTIANVDIPGDAVAAQGATSISIAVGSGGGGVSSGSYSTSAGSSGYATVSFNTITGYSGGTTNITIGDIIIAASAGPEIFVTGSGTGSSGGFKLPTTQVPIIEFVGGSPTTAAIATATLTGGAVSGITLVSGGSGYTAAPNVRFLHGAGSGTTATANINASGAVTSVTLNVSSNPSTAYDRYLKFRGTELERYVVIEEQDCTDVKTFSVKVARGNGSNGGDLPENGGDELRLFYNTSLNLNFTEYLGPLVPIPLTDEITSGYDGTSGNTKWYTYSIDLPPAAQTSGVRFKLLQARNVASGANDNAGDTDQYGICDIIYEYKEITELQFVSTPGRISTAADELTYEVAGPSNSTYTSGISVNDVSFNLTSSTPLVPVPSIDPDFEVSLLEPYILVKHLIKAF